MERNEIKIYYKIYYTIIYMNEKYNIAGGEGLKE